MLHTYNIYVLCPRNIIIMCVYMSLPWCHDCIVLPFYLTYFVGGGGGIERPLDSQDVCISSKWRGPKTHPNISKKTTCFFYSQGTGHDSEAFLGCSSQKTQCWITLILSMWLSWVWDTARYTFFQILLDFLPMRKWSSLTSIFVQMGWFNHQLVTILRRRIHFETQWPHDPMTGETQ